MAKKKKTKATRKGPGRPKRGKGARKGRTS